MTDVVLDAVFWELTESGVPALIQQWRVSEGDLVHAGQSLASVRVGQDNVDLPAPHAGTVEEILVGSGDSFQLGDTLARLIAI